MTCPSTTLSMRLVAALLCVSTALPAGAQTVSDSYSDSTGLQGDAGYEWPPANSGGQQGNTEGTSLMCIGRTFNPVSDTDWNNAFPITWGGSAPENPPWMYEPSVCDCPSHIYPAISLPGLGLTYWEPNTVMEIQREPGCLSSMGGTQALSGYESLRANGNESRSVNQNYSRMQIHNYQYPVFSMLSMFMNTMCGTSSGVNLLDMTETDSVWNMGGGWQSAMSPTSALTSTLEAQAACAVEAAAMALGSFPMPALEWCNGSNGGASTFGGDLPQSNSNWSSNALSAYKYLRYWAYIGGVFTTIGPAAICYSYAFPVLDKAQFRYQQIGPWPLMGIPVRLGDSPYRLGPVVTNLDIRDSTDVLLWQGMQCCMRL